MKTSVISAYVLLTLMTIAYCVAIWYGIAICNAYLANISTSLPTFGFFIAPFPMSGIWFGAIHWQVIAVGSLVWSFIWGRRRANQSNNDSEYMLPMMIHLAWVVLALLLHAIGAMAPMIEIGYSIG